MHNLNRKSLISKVIYLLILFIAVSGAGYYYYQYQMSSKDERETKQLVLNVGKLMKLPDEIPVIATVSDSKKLESQPFFKWSQNGDKVLIFQKFGRAILYRPTSNLIIDVVPLQIKPNAAVETSVARKISVVLYNGTTTPGITNNFENVLATKYTNIIIVDKQQAVKNTYKGNLIVDITKKNSEIVKALSKDLSADIATNIPVGEAKPNSDILIIFGK